MELNLREQLILLFHHELKDKFCINDYRFDTAFIGAMIFELIELGKIEIKDDKIKCISKKDGLSKDLKEMYLKIKAKENNKKISYWVDKLLVKSEKFRKCTVKDMSQKGLLELSEKKYFWFFTKQTTHINDSKIREDIVNRLRACLLDDAPPTYYDLALIGLIDATNVYRLISNIKGECPKMKEKYIEMLGGKSERLGVSEVIASVSNALFISYTASLPKPTCSGR